MFPAPLSRDHPNFLSNKWYGSEKFMVQFGNTKVYKKKQHIFRNNIEFWNIIGSWYIFPFISVAFPKKQTGDTPGPKPATLLAEFRGGTLNLETCGNFACWLAVEPPMLLVKLDSFLQVGVKIKSYLKPPPLNRCVEFCHMRLGAGEKTHVTFWLLICIYLTCLITSNANGAPLNHSCCSHIFK